MKKFFASISCALLLGVLALPSQAQVTVDLGPRVGFDIGGDIEELFIGADARFGIADVPVDFGATFDYYLVESGVTFYQINLNAYYDFLMEDMPFVPYAGAGLGISRISYDLGEVGEFLGQNSISDSDTGINLIGGARFNAGNVFPFAQIQLTIGDLDLFTIGGGVLIPISR